MSGSIASVPAQFSQRVVDLLDQQFWRWGCDVKHRSGNQLIRFGFRRVPPPDPEPPNSSAYSLELDPVTRIVLRGSAAFYGNENLGGLLTRRFDSQPYRTPLAHLEELPHTPDSLPPLQPFQSTDLNWRPLASALFHWIAEYEAWIVREFGTQYIQQSLDQRKKRPAVAAVAAVSEWLKIAGELA